MKELKEKSWNPGGNEAAIPDRPLLIAQIAVKRWRKLNAQGTALFPSYANRSPLHNDLTHTDIWCYQNIWDFPKVTDDGARFAQTSQVLEMKVHFIL